MNIDGRTIWQQAAGDTDRNYVELCLRWGVILNGPGQAGPWPEFKSALEQSGSSARKLKDIKRFAEEMANGDLVVLRIGTSSVPAVGEIVGNYEWSDDFGDVDGWDLQHVRRVRWLWHDHDNPKTFTTYALKQGDTTQRLKDGEVKEWLQALEINGAAAAAPLPSIPRNEQQLVSLEAISEFLFDHGVASSSINTLLDEVGELARIATWYQRSSEAPSEHETVAYLVVPLLRALGWTPQRMAVEWNHVDVALFERLPRVDDTLQIVVEAKKKGNSCLTAKSQAANYAATRPGCSRLIVTDGLRYGIYIRDGAQPFRLYAYLNLDRMLRHYPILECHGAEEALLSMTPEWKPSMAKEPPASEPTK
jgi:hypothetical protein